MGRRRERLGRAVEVLSTARRKRLLRVLREIGLAGQRPATAEGARELRLALEDLGTTYIKLGQLLSSRPDLMPDIYIEELSRLVDEVPPVPFSVIEPVIRRELDRGVFVQIDPEPVAAASIAQIHKALLHDGRAIVVKVRRPGVLEQAQVDLALLRSSADFLERRSERAQLLQLSPLADEVEQHLLSELDFNEEANNTELIGRIIGEDSDLVVPKVVRPYVAEAVLVLEHIEGRKIDSDHGLEPDHASRLARELFRSYVRQVAAEGVYHADPHRGNILLTDDRRLALLDFGLLGRLDDDTRSGIAQLLLALSHNRADDVAALILSLSMTTLESDEPGFVSELRRKLPRYHWRPLSGIRAGDALADLQRMAVTYGIRLPTSFALVGKTLSQADSIARTLDPELDPVALIEEESLELMVTEAEARMAPNQLFSYLFTQLGAISRLPRRVAQVADHLEAGTLKVGVVPTGLEDTEHMLRSVANRIGAAMIVVGLLISSALMARVDHTVSLVGFLLSGLLALYLFWRIIRTPGDL